MRPGTTESYVDPGAAAGVPTSQIAFLGDEGVQISWDVGGYGAFDATPLVIPQAAKPVATCTWSFHGSIRPT